MVEEGSVNASERTMAKVMALLADLAEALNWRPQRALPLVCSTPLQSLLTKRRARSTDHRLESAWFGATLKERAIEQALVMIACPLRFIGVIDPQP